MQRRTFVFGLAAVASSWQAPARAQLVRKYAEDLQNGEFNWFPERSLGGPILIIVSIPEQRVHVFRNGIRIAASSCSTGKPGHSTPTGVFNILQKDKHHRSSTYSNAPMPNMNRLTWSGIAIHAGQLPGYPASHGCVRLPLQFSELLFGITKLGMTVVIADNNSYPTEVVHPGLVLGNYARSEFGAVERAIKTAQYSEGHTTSPKHVSIVVSGANRNLTIFENDHIVASGKVSVDDEKRPLARSVHTLVASDSEKGDLKWSAALFGHGTKGGPGPELRRIKAEPNLHEEIRKRVRHGMTVVTTDEESADRNRTRRDFVVIDSLY